MQQDKSEIIDTILRFAYAFDTKDGTLLRDCLCDELHVDYRDFSGEPPCVISGDEFVLQRSKDLAGLRTQHMNTNHLVHIDDKEAECTSCFLIHRMLDDIREYQVQNMFNTAGHYIHGLQKTEKGWRINRIKQTLMWRYGNPAIHGAFRQ